MIEVFVEAVLYVARASNCLPESSHQLKYEHERKQERGGKKKNVSLHLVKECFS